MLNYFLYIAIFTTALPPLSKMLAPAEKIGAGLLFMCEGEALLLRRAPSSRNPLKWGLPGGNADADDGDELLKTATREAAEEMCQLPAGFEVQGSYLTKRGKRGQKHYTVFVATVPPEARTAYQPQLNEEHVDWRWFPLSQISSLAAASSSSSTAAVQLHPVIEQLLQQHPGILQSTTA